MTVCFLSYRRADVPDVVGRLHDRIEARFGAGSVFRDVDSLAAGTDFRDAIRTALADCDVVLAMIGPRFLRPAEPDATDYVVEEIGRALEDQVRVIPVLVHGTSMPAADAMPERIRPLAYLHASRLRGDPDFGHDVDKLLRTLADVAIERSAASPRSVTLVSGPHKGITFPIMKERTLIGRHPSCEIRIEAIYASKFHAAIIDRDGQLLCEDLGSSNGTFVNGVRVDGRVPLHDGDLIHIGNSVLQVHVAAAAAAAPAVATLRLTVHVAQFARTGTPCCFVNMTNVTAGPLEVTHVWIEATPPVFPTVPDRPLPKRLEPMESWETWIPLTQLPPHLTGGDGLYTGARARLSTGDVVHSVRNESVPPFGSVPGGPIGRVP